MLDAMNRFLVHIGRVPVGDAPRVVGIVSDSATVPGLLAQAAPGCDLVEMRLDRMDVRAPDWPAAAARLEAAGYPVIATLRIAAEGGAWDAPETERRPHLQQALAQCACVDIELRSALLPELVATAGTLGKALIVSHHDYDRTPPLDELRAVIARAAVAEHVIVKLAVRVNETADIDRLRELLADPPGRQPLCLIGMGDPGTPTRIEFPRLGSCLAYGHLDGATAPGQLSCRELADRIAAPAP